MSYFNPRQIEAFETGKYWCDNCGAQMVFEDDMEDTLVCLKCGSSVRVEDYGFTEEELLDRESDDEDWDRDDDDDEDEDY